MKKLPDWAKIAIGIVIGVIATMGVHYGWAPGDLPEIEGSK